MQTKDFDAVYSISTHDQLHEVREAFQHRDQGGKVLLWLDVGQGDGLLIHAVRELLTGELVPLSPTLLNKRSLKDRKRKKPTAHLLVTSADDEASELFEEEAFEPTPMDERISIR